ncbi:MAG: M50 family metallopeptidase [Patescibacteria group bacterium]
MINVLLILLLLSLLVIIHELGHYLMAKKFGVAVEEFGFGYPPRILSLFKIKETLFSLNAIPFGGFVKLRGEEADTSNAGASRSVKSSLASEAGEESKKTSLSVDKNSLDGVFFLKPMLPRIAIISAGPLFNLIFGMVAFSVIFSFSGIPVPLDNQPRILQTLENSPAAQAGVEAETSIIAFVYQGETTPVSSIDDVQKYVTAHAGQEVTVITSGLCREESCQEVSQSFNLYLRTAEETPAGEGSMGIVFSDFYLKFYPWYEMPFRGIVYGIGQALAMGWLMVTGIVQLFTNLFLGNGLPVDVAGPVGIAHQAQKSDLLAQGWLMVLNFMGLLSINLAVMNILPIPALDGGRILMILMEKVIGKSRVDKVEGYVNYGGFIALMGLIILITFKDVARIVQGN